MSVQTGSKAQRSGNHFTSEKYPNPIASMIPDYYFLDSTDERQRERLLRSVLEESEEKQEALKCSACGYVITHRESEISMGGQHAHRFSNPSGHSFTIGCFEEAPGCSKLGEETHEHSWFPGYAWTIALCAACGLHVGWRFRSPNAEFYGLILDRLISEASG